VETNHAGSLRRQVDKWMARPLGARLRVTRTILRNRRCVRVEVTQATGTFVLFFFQLDDRSWGVVPPSPVRPAMRIYREAA
jgi:hypothetical protein